MNGAPDDYEAFKDAFSSLDDGWLDGAVGRRQQAGVHAVLAIAIEECAKVGDPWTKAGEIRLRMGELTAGEMRAVKAATNAIAAAIRKMKGGESLK